MTCKECKERLHPDNPERAVYLKGRRLAPICDTCGYKDSVWYVIEKLEDKEEASHLICEVKNCPIWKTVAQLQQSLDALKCEIAHVHAGLHEKKSKEKEGW